MGGSGAGKSTLLDLLAYRKTGGFITGEYYIGGQAEKPSSKWCSYVTQDNVHISLFTVRETLEYAALLRLDENTPLQKRKERAVDVMKMLGLEDVADVLVGSSLLKGISGGQARRLSIGVEIMQLPDGKSTLCCYTVCAFGGINLLRSRCQQQCPCISVSLTSTYLTLLFIPPTHNNTVIFLDEPTTGLDSQISHEVSTAVFKRGREGE